MSNKTIVYIAHPIGGDVDANLADLARILRKINLSEEHKYIVPVAPYYSDVVALNDNNALERKRGIENGKELLASGLFKELWLTGEKISFGMTEEIKVAVLNGIKVVDYINKF